MYKTSFSCPHHLLSTVIGSFPHWTDMVNLISSKSLCDNKCVPNSQSSLFNKQWNAPFLIWTLNWKMSNVSFYSSCISFIIFINQAPSLLFRLCLARKCIGRRQKSSRSKARSQGPRNISTTEFDGFLLIFWNYKAPLNSEEINILLTFIIDFYKLSQT